MGTFDASTKRGVRNAAMVALMSRAGMRVGQVVAMERYHYEPGAHVVTVPAGTAKSAQERYIPIDSVTRDLLQRWWDVRDKLNLSGMAPLFATVNAPDRGNRIHAAYIREMLREAADKASIHKRVSPSGLKKTYEVALAERSSRLVAQMAQHIDEPRSAVGTPLPTRSGEPPSTSLKRVLNGTRRVSGTSVATLYRHSRLSWLHITTSKSR